MTETTTTAAPTTAPTTAPATAVRCDEERSFVERYPCGDAATCWLRVERTASREIVVTERPLCERHRREWVRLVERHFADCEVIVKPLHPEA